MFVVLIQLMIFTVLVTMMSEVQLGDGSNTNKDASSGFVKVVTSDKFKYISAKSFSEWYSADVCCNNR